MTDSSRFEDEDEILAAEMALGLLDAENVQLTRARMARDADFARLVMNWQERLVRMTDEIRGKRPPDRVRKRILAQVFPPVNVPLLERVWVWKTVSFAALAMMAFIGWMAYQIPTTQAPAPIPSGPVYATQLTADATLLQVLAVVDPARGDVAINRVAGAASAGRSLELWAIVPDTPPISLGVLPEDAATTRVQLPEGLVAQAAAITLAISDEPAGGSPTGAPTGDILAANPVSEL